MLQSIYIQNYALIDTLDISFTPGFSALPAEPAPGNRLFFALFACLLETRPAIKL